MTATTAQSAFFLSDLSSAASVALVECCTCFMVLAMINMVVALVAGVAAVTSGEAPERARTRRLPQGEARLLAPVPDEEAAGGDARIRPEGPRGGDRQPRRKESRPR